MRKILAIESMINLPDRHLLNDFKSKVDLADRSRYKVL